MLRRCPVGTTRFCFGRGQSVLATNGLVPPLMATIILTRHRDAREHWLGFTWPLTAEDEKLPALDRPFHFHEFDGTCRKQCHDTHAAMEPGVKK